MSTASIGGRSASAIGGGWKRRGPDGQRRHPLGEHRVQQQAQPVDLDIGARMADPERAQAAGAAALRPAPPCRPPAPAAAPAARAPRRRRTGARCSRPATPRLVGVSGCRLTKRPSRYCGIGLRALEPRAAHAARRTAAATAPPSPPQRARRRARQRGDAAQQPARTRRLATASGTRRSFTPALTPRSAARSRTAPGR